MPSPGNLFGGGASGVNAESFFVWSVGSALAQSLLDPVYIGIAQDIWKAAVAAGIHNVIPPADLANMVVKNIIDQANGASVASASGVDPNDFNLLVLNTGEPPGLETVMEMARRQFIQWDYADPTTPSVEGAVRTSHIYDYWYHALRQMGDVSQPGGGVPISPADAVEATLRGQRQQAAMEVEAGLSAVNAERFQILLDTAGRPPAPGELLVLLRRKLIPLGGTGPDVLSFQQGIFEGDNKDKWWPMLAKLADYIPPPRSIATLESHGVISQAQAAEQYQANGLTPELAAIYAQSAVAVRVAANRALTEAEILKLYADHLTDETTATAMLANVGVPGPVAAYLLELEDFTTAAAAYRNATSRLGTLYVGRKIDRQSALDGLRGLDVPAEAAAHLISTWDQERASRVAELTAAEVADLLFYNIEDQPTCMAMLEGLGYDPLDAWRRLSLRAHGPLPDKPGPGDLAGAATPIS